MPLHFVRPEDEDKDIEHFIENSSDIDNSVIDLDFDDMQAISLTSSMVHPECFDQSELNDLFCDFGHFKKIGGIDNF